MDTVTRVQILYEAVHIKHCAYTFWKGMHATIFLPVIGKS